MLMTLTYASQVSDSVSLQCIKKILESSRRYNREFHITGMLCHGNGRFMQCIEGDREAINTLYARLLIDNRHTDLTLLNYDEIQIRQFNDWSMGYISAYDLPIQKLIHQVCHQEFRPELFSATQAAQLLRLLKGYLHPQSVVAMAS